VDRKDVLTTRLVSGKVTFLHHSCWDSFIPVATSKEAWQTHGLSFDTGRLLALVGSEGIIRTDKSGTELRLVGSIGDASRQLEKRLLIHSAEIHTESGSHAKVLQSWSNWLRAADFNPRPVSLTMAKQQFEVILDSLNQQYRGNASLPWP